MIQLGICEGKMDIKLYYQEKETGEPLILLHGNGEDSSYFINQIDYFQNACLPLSDTGTGFYTSSEKILLVFVSSNRQ